MNAASISQTTSHAPRRSNMTAHAVIKTAKNWLKYVEFGSMVVVMLSLGVILGEIATEDIERISKIVNIVATAACGLLALVTLYYTQFDRRYTRRLIFFIALSLLCVVNGVKLFGLFSLPIYDILFSAASVFTVLFMLVGAIQGRYHCILKGGNYDHNQCRPQPSSDRR